jgi:hydrogenase maturation protease
VSSLARILVQAIGNPLRSDDGAGPLLIERLGERLAGWPDAAVDLEWVYQLQIENAEQWQRYEMVIVVDADASATQPVSWREIAAQPDLDSGRFDSHQQSPDAICQLMRQLFAGRPDAAPTRIFVLGIQAEVFELGETLSPRAREALAAAEQYLVQVLSGEHAMSEPATRMC